MGRNSTMVQSNFLLVLPTLGTPDLNSVDCILSLQLNQAGSEVTWILGVRGCRLRGRAALE